MGLSHDFNNKCLCIIGWFLLTIDICSTFLAIYPYCFLLTSIIEKISINMQYFSVVIAIIHICFTMFFLILPCITYLTCFKSISTIESPTQPEINEDTCFQQDPWLLYHTKYDFVRILRIILLMFDAAVMCVFSDRWNCVNSYLC